METMEEERSTRWLTIIAATLVLYGCGSSSPSTESDPRPITTSAPTIVVPTTAATTTTSPPSFDGLTIAAVGDWYEDDPADDGYVEDAIRTRDAIIDAEPDLTLGLGDFSYGTNDPDDFFRFVAPLEELSPIYPTFGNHDGFSKGEVDRSSFYRDMVEHFGLDEFFAVDDGPIRFISINSEYRENSPRYQEQLALIAGAMKEAFEDPSIEMIIPFFHNAMVNPLSERGPNRILQEVFYPLLDAYSAKIPLALQADHHIYTRSHLVRQLPDRRLDECIGEGQDRLCEAQYEVIDPGRDANPVVYTEPTGIVFVTVGTGGAHATSLTPEADYVPVRHKPVSATVDPQGGTFGYLHLTIDADATFIEGQFRLNNGEVLDWFRIEMG